MGDQARQEDRKLRGLDLMPPEEPKKSFKQNGHHQTDPRLGANLLALWWMAEEGEGRRNTEEEAGV